MPLPADLRSRMEGALGADFSAVRVHVGPQAPSIGAVAFTAGADIFVAPGQYRPETPMGQRLLAHELAHVVQQRQGRVRAPSTGAGPVIVHDAALEAEADRAGLRSAQRSLAPPAARPSPVAQRMKATNNPIPNELEYGSSSMATTCAVNVWNNATGALVYEGYVSNGSGMHAEERVIAHLQQAVNSGTLTPNMANPHYHVFLTVSKSPCHSTGLNPTRTDGQPGCQERINHVNANGLSFGGTTVTFLIQWGAVKPYQPKMKGGKQSSIDANNADPNAFPFVR